MNYQIRLIHPSEVPLLKEKGYMSVSLSVQKANYAMKMYQKAGFKILSDDGEEVIMQCPL